MTDPQNMAEWHPNRGSCPAHLRGTDKRVMVKLRNGQQGGPWPASGRGAVLWDAKGDYPFDVMEWQECK